MANEQRQTIDLMEFTHESVSALVALGHVGHREFRRALLARASAGHSSTTSPLYEYAIFRDDETLLFNARPDDVGAKPVTVAYFGFEGPEQP